MAVTYKVKCYNRSTNRWVGNRNFTIPNWELLTEKPQLSEACYGDSQSQCSFEMRRNNSECPDFGTCDLIHNPTDTGPEIGVPGAFTSATTSNFNTFLGAHGFSIQTISDINSLSFYFDDHRNIRFTYTRYDPGYNSGYYCSAVQYCVDDTIIFTRNFSISYSDIFTIPWYFQGINKLVAYNPQWYINTYNLENNSRMFMQAGYVPYTLANVSQDLKNWFNNMEPTIVDTDNPYIDGGTSGEGGGGGNFSEDSDDPTTDDLPDIDAVGTGMATIFKPSRGQLRSLSELFWNSNVFTFLQNLVENITNMFISLAMVPFDVQAGSTVSVTWLGIDTAVSLTLAAKQFYEFNMGTIDLANDPRIFTSGSALDYAPFSSLGIYLPFIGYRDLDIDECRDAGINLRYRIDILSGSCVAIIKVGGKDIYEFTGNCLTQIPITNENMQSLVTDAVNIGLAVANAESAGAVASGVEADAIAAGEPLTAEKSAHMDQMVGRSRGQLASATANAAMGMKPNFAKTGAVSGSVAMMSVKQPYLFLKTPRQSIPDHYQRYCGFPSNISGKLGDFSGYTVVEDIRLNGLVATSPEVAEIYKLLKSGVII